MRFCQPTHMLMCWSLKTLTSIIRTGSPILVEQIDLVNSFIFFLSQMTIFRWLTSYSNPWQWLSKSCSFGFISLDASICSTMAFPPLGNADQVVVQVSIDFLSNSQWDSQFHCIAYDYSFAGWDGLCDLWEIFHEREYSAAAASEFCDCVQVGINVSIPHCKYQVKPHSPPWLSFACAAVVVHRNDFFVCTNKIIFLSQK